jgi:hypothetical protein
MDSTEYCPETTWCLVMGGTPADNAHAQRAADTAMRGFLEQAL